MFAQAQKNEWLPCVSYSVFGLQSSDFRLHLKCKICRESKTYKL